MKGLALLLLLTNLGVAGYFLGMDFWSGAQPATHAPLHVDRLNLRSSSRTPAALPSTPGNAASATLCVEWRGLAQSEIAPVREHLKTMTSAHVMSFSEVPMNIQQWVVFPPLPSRAAAQDKLMELSAVGIQDISIIRSGIWANALSLGLYANEESARQRVRELEEKGVYGIRIETQPQQGTAYYFVIRSDDADALKSLNEAKTAYPGSALARVACQFGTS